MRNGLLMGPGGANVRKGYIPDIEKRPAGEEG